MAQHRPMGGLFQWHVRNEVFIEAVRENCNLYGLTFPEFWLRRTFMGNGFGKNIKSGFRAPKPVNGIHRGGSRGRGDSGSAPGHSPSYSRFFFGFIYPQSSSFTFLDSLNSIKNLTWKQRVLFKILQFLYDPFSSLPTYLHTKDSYDATACRVLWALT
jgi:hypothetical protein